MKSTNCWYCGDPFEPMAFTMNADGRAVHYRCWVELKNAEGFFDNLVLPEQEKP